MKKFILILFLFILPQNSIAQETDGTVGITIIEPKKPFTDNMTVYGGLGLSDYYYKESVTEPLKSIENGTLTTFILGATKVFKPEEEDPTVYRLEARFSPSSTTYDGTYQNGKPFPSFERKGSRFFEAEGTALFPMSNTFSLYTGLGYHSWLRHSGGVTGSYTEFYRWGYLPLGLIYNIPIKDNFSVNADLSLRPTFMGKMALELEGVGSPDFTLGSTTGIKIQVNFKLKTSNTSNLIFSPWYEVSAIGESNFVPLEDLGDGRKLGIKEPASNTTQKGLLVSYALAL